MRVRMLLLASLTVTGCKSVGLSPFKSYLPNDDGGHGPVLTGHDDNGSDTDSDTDRPGVGTDTSTPAPDTDVASVDTDVAPQGAPQITSIDPTYGTNFGGTRVTITGKNLDHSLQVEFGGEAATVVSTHGTTAVVDTPAVSVVGNVDVRLTGAHGGDTLQDGYRYWADGDGKTGGIVELDRTRYRGGYWSKPNLSQSNFGGGFLTPVKFEFWQLFTATQGTCRNDYTGGPALHYRDPGAHSLTVSGGGNTTDMPEDQTTAGFFASDDLALNDTPTTVKWQLDPVTGGPAWWPAFAVPDLLQGLDNFEVSTPDIAATDMPSVGKTVTLKWTGSGGDYVLIDLLQESYPSSRSTTPTVVQEVSCSVPDTGSFTIPTSAWNGWRINTDDYLDVRVGRVKTQTSVLPMDRSTMAGVSIAWVHGAAAMSSH